MRIANYTADQHRRNAVTFVWSLAQSGEYGHAVYSFLGLAKAAKVSDPPSKRWFVIVIEVNLVCLELLYMSLALFAELHQVQLAMRWASVCRIDDGVFVPTQVRLGTIVVDQEG